jgi:transitional endoplasmic reticulum ATPase
VTKLKEYQWKRIEFIIKNQRPTVPLSELKKYEEMRKKIEEEIDENKSNERPRIGFKP